MFLLHPLFAGMPRSLKDLHIIFALSLYQVAMSFMITPLPGEGLKDSGICVLFFASFLLIPQPGGWKRFRDLQLFLHHFWYHPGAWVKALHILFLHHPWYHPCQMDVYRSLRDLHIIFTSSLIPPLPCILSAWSCYHPYQEVALNLL